MKIKETENHFGTLTDLRSKRNLGEAIALFDFEYNIPQKCSLFYKQDVNLYSSILKSENEIGNYFLLDNIYEKIYILFKYRGSNIEINLPYNNSIIGEIKRLIFIKKKINRLEGESENNDLKIYVNYSPINFLHYNLSWFRFHALNELKNLETVSQKYEKRLSDLGNDFLYSMWVNNYESEFNESVLILPYHLFIFSIKNEQDTETIIDYVLKYIESISFIIRIFSKQENDFLKIYFKRLYNNEKYEIEIYNNINIDDLNDNLVSNISGNNYLELINFVYKNFIIFENSKKTIFDVVINRLNESHDIKDYTIIIPLIHVALMHLIKYHCNNKNEKIDTRLSSKKNIIKILEKLNISTDEITVNNLYDFNCIRNKKFKEIDLNHSNILDSFKLIDYVLDIIYELIYRLFDNNDIFHDIFINAMKKVYSYNIIAKVETKENLKELI